MGINEPLVRHPNLDVQLGRQIAIGASPSHEKRHIARGIVRDASRRFGHDCYHFGMSTCGGPTSPEPPASNRLAARSSVRSSRKRCPGLDKQPWPGELGERIYREHLGRCLEALGRADEDDPQRVSADALAEGGSGAREEAHGRLLLRRGRGPAARVTCRSRPNRRSQSSRDAAPVVTGSSLELDHRIDGERQLRVCSPHRGLGLRRRAARAKMNPR